MKPLRIFAFGLTLSVAFVVLALLTPNDGWKIGATTLYFPIWWQADNAESHYKDIGDIIASVGLDADGDPTDSLALDFVTTDSTSAPLPDSAQNKLQQMQDTSTATTASEKTVVSKADTTIECRQPFDLPEGKDTIMFRLLRKILNNNNRKLPVRILHYGDSQIESDRITSTIRNYLQRKYGGIGCGYIPVLPASDVSRSFQQDIPANWRRYSIQNQRALAKNHYFGLAGAFTRYISATPADTITHIGLKPIGFGYLRARTFSQVRMLYGNNSAPAPIAINRVDTQMLKKSTMVSSVVWSFPKPQRALRIDFLSGVIPDIYGLTLDGVGGIAVDNIPLRGSSGLEFAKMDIAQLRQMYAIMNVGAVILQFGANAVINFNKSPETYAQQLRRQIKELQTFSPTMLIIVIGASDISQHGPGGYKSYPNLEKILEKQREVALETGCVFWDLRAAMGGDNSMPSWVAANPPLANKDYVHFTLKGAKIVGELFCQAWNVEEHKFLTTYPALAPQTKKEAPKESKADTKPSN